MKNMVFYLPHPSACHGNRKQFENKKICRKILPNRSSNFNETLTLFLGDTKE